MRTAPMRKCVQCFTKYTLEGQARERRNLTGPFGRRKIPARPTEYRPKPPNPEAVAQGDGERMRWAITDRGWIVSLLMPVREEFHGKTLPEALAWFDVADAQRVRGQGDQLRSPAKPSRSGRILNHRNWRRRYARRAGIAGTRSPGGRAVGRWNTLRQSPGNN